MSTGVVVAIPCCCDTIHACSHCKNGSMLGVYPISATLSTTTFQEFTGMKKGVDGRGVKIEIG